MGEIRKKDKIKKTLGHNVQSQGNLADDFPLKGIKVPPHSIEAEISLLGAALLDPEAWERISHRLASGDFYQPRHRMIFEAMQALSMDSQPLDVVTLSEYLKNLDKLDYAGGDAYLFELANSTPSTANVIAYAEIVRERSIYRQLIQTSGEIASIAYRPEGRSALEVLDEAERRVFSIAEQSAKEGGPESINTLFVEVIDRLDQLAQNKGPVTGLSTGFMDLDHMTSGLQPSDLVIVAARPSMGKTSFAMNIAEHAALQSGKPMLVFSMEMPGSALAMRMISSLGRIDQHKLRIGKLSEEEYPRMTSTMAMLSKTPFLIDDTPALNPAELRARARRVVKEKGQLGLIVVDYLQLMQVPGRAENRTNEISEISRALKQLAKELHVPVIALSQLNRGVEQRGDKRPIMSDLRDSGALEQDADLILFIYRDEVYNENSQDKGVAEILIAKQRNGPIGKTRLAFLPQYTRFENLASGDYDV